MNRNYFSALEKNNFSLYKYILILFFFLAFATNGNAQHIFASSQTTGSTGVLCLACTVSNPANAADGNLETHSTLNISVGLAATTYQNLIFPALVPANTPVTVKLGSGDNLLSLTALGGITIQAYNGGTAVGSPIAASSLISVLSNNNQYELTITPAASYDRVRVTLNGGLIGALANLYLYEAFYSSGGNVACGSAYDELNGISAGLVGLGASVGGVVNPQNAIDGDATTYATLNAGVGVAGAAAQETAIFQSPSQPGDSVKLILSVPQSLITAGVLSNVSITTFIGNTSNNDTQYLNSSLINVQLLGTQVIGSTTMRKVVVTYAPASIFDRVQLKLGGGIASVLSTLNFYEAQEIIPQPVVSINGVQANSTSFCAGGSATLTVAATPNTQYNWYTQPTGGVSIAAGSTFVTPALNATTTYYVAANHTGCTDQSARAAVVINVNPIPATPVIPTSTVTICSGSQATFTANNVAGVSFNWYTQPSGGNPVFTGNPFTTLPLNTTTSYYVEAANGSCSSTSRAQVTVNVNALPAAPSLVAVNATICSGNTAVLSIASPISGYTYNWYANLAGGTPLFTGTNFTTPVLTANATYYVEAVNGSGCISSSRTTANVTVLPQPADPVLNADNSTVTSGQSATITVTNPQANTTYNWYVSNTATTPFFTGTSYQTPALTTSTTYYVSAANAIGCPSANRTQITITVAPDVSVTPHTQNINAGSTATFTASSTTPGAVFNWYTSPTGGTPIYTGSTFTTPPLFSNTTYYVDATDPATGVTSVSRVPAVVNINAIPVNPVPCDAAITQVNSTSGILCLGCAIYNPGGSVDNNSNTFSQLNVPIGIAGGYVQQTLQFANLGIAGDSVVLVLGIPGTLASVNVLSQISLATYNGATFNNDRFALNGSQISVNLLSGTSIFRVAFKAASAFDRVEVRLNSGLAGIFNQLNIYYAAEEVPAPVISTPNITACQGTQVTVTATVLSNTSVNWYTQATGGSPVFTGNPFTTPLLNSSITYYAEATGADGCTQTVRTPVTINVQPTPAQPVVAANNITICSGQQATFTANGVAGVTFNWYTQPSGGTPVFSGNSFTTPALNSTTIYYVEAASGSCSNATRTQVTATVNPSPAPPIVVSNNVTICSGQQATFTANSVAGVTFNWYASPNGGTPVFTGNPFTTGALNSTTSYYVEAINGSCTGSPRTQVTATVNQTPGVPVLAQTPVQICSGSSATLTVNSVPPGVTINWYANPTGGTPLATGTQFVTPPLTSNTSYYAEASSGTCTSQGRAQADVIVNPIPATPTFTVLPSAQITSGQTVTITASDVTPGTIFNWYTTPSGGTPIYSGASFTTPALTSNTTYYIEGASATGCVSTARAQVTITVNPVFSTSCDFASTQTNSANGLCIGCTVSNPNYAADADTTTASQLNMTVAALGASVSQTLIFGDTGNAGDPVTLKLEIPAGLLVANVLSAIQIESYNGVTANGDLTNLSGAAVSIHVLSGGNVALIKFVPSAIFDRVQITLNSGLVAALTSLNIYYATKQVATPILSAAAANICSGNTATFTVSNPFADVTYNWYDSPAGGNLLGSGISFTTPVLSATTTYYVESSRTSNNCANPNRVAATVNVTPSPAVPIPTQSTVNICSGDNTVLSVTNAGTSTVNWYDAPTNGNLLFTGAVFSVSPSSATTYYTEFANGVCLSPNRAQVTVNVNPRPTAFALQNNNLLICSGSTATLQITSPETGVNYNWYTVSTGGIAVFTGNVFTTPALTTDVVYYIEAVNATSGCSNTSGRVTATITISSPVVAPALSSTTIQVCSGSTSTILVNNPLTGFTYNWYTTPSGGSSIFSGSAIVLNNLTNNISYYVEAVNSTGCISGTRTRVDIQVNPLPVAPGITDQTGSSTPSVCSGHTAQLTASSSTPGVTFNWYDAAAGGTLLFTGTTFNTPALTSNANYFVETVNSSSGCTSATRTPVTVTVNPQPSNPVVANGATTTVCSGSTVTLNIANPQAGYTYNWYTASTGGSLASSGQSFTFNPAANVSYYVEAVSSTGCLSAGRTRIDVIVAPNPVAPVIKDPSGSSAPAICSGSTVTLTATGNGVNITYNWYNAQTGGSPLFTGNSFTTQPLVAATTYYVEAINTSTGCVSSTRVPITVNVVNTETPIATIDPAGLTICANNTAQVSVTNPDPNTVYNFYSTASGGSPIFTGTTFTTPLLTTNTTYYVEAVNPNYCHPSARTAVNVNVTPIAPAPIPASSVINICAGAYATLSVQSPQPGVAYNWYDNSSKTNLLFTGSTFIVGPVNTNATYYVESTNGICPNPNLASIQVVADSKPSAPLLVNNAVIVCDGQQQTLAVANPQSGYTYNWYDAAAGGTLLFTGTTFNTPALTSNANYFVETANTSSGCTSATRTQATVTVNPQPSSPVITNGAATTVCTGSAVTLDISAPQPGYTYNWYNAQTGGSPVFSGQSFTVSPGSNISYYVESVSSTGCLSAGRTRIDVTVNPQPSMPVIANGATTTVCTGSAVTLNIANPQAGYTYNWYTAPTGGSLVSSGQSFTINPAANVSYYVEAMSSTGCLSAGRTRIDVIVAPNPVAPVIKDPSGSSTPAICSGTTVTLTATGNGVNIAYNWYNAQTGGFPLFTGNSFTTPALVAATTYYVEAINTSTGCVSPTRVPITVNVINTTAPAVAIDPAGLTICANNTAQVSVTNPDPNTVYNFYSTAGGSPIFTGTTFITPQLTTNSTYYVEAVNPNYCRPSARVAVNVNVTPVAPAPIPASSVMNVCIGSYSTLSVKAPQPGVIYSWYDSPSKTNLLFTGSTFITGPVNANATYYIEATNGVCANPNLENVQVIADSKPSAPLLVSNAVTACQGQQQTLAIANPQSGYTYNWYDAATGGNLLHSGTNFVTPVLQSGAVYYIEAVNGTGCTSASRSVAAVTVVAAPSTPQLTNALLSICPGGNVALTATSDPNCTVNWYLNTGGGTPIFTGPTFTTPALTSNTTYYLDATNNTTGCTSSKKAIVTINMSQPLAVPVVTLGTTSASSVSFSWQAVPGAVGYEVSLDNGQTFITPSSGATGLTHVANNLQPGQKVSIVVRANGKDGCEQSGNSIVEGASADNPFGDNVYIPNTFTPNGDGKNDIFLVYGTQIQKIILSVYDQWGELIYRTTDKSAGWDGTYKGRNQPVGVYVYYVEATMYDGNAVNKKGTITLVR